MNWRHLTLFSFFLFFVFVLASGNTTRTDFRLRAQSSTLTPVPTTGPATFTCCTNASCGGSCTNGSTTITCSNTSACVKCYDGCYNDPISGRKTGGSIINWGCSTVNGCTAGSCHPTTCSYGGGASCGAGQVSTIDDCGGIGCDAPGTCGGGGGGSTGGGGTPSCTPNCAAQTCTASICPNQVCTGTCGEICAGTMSPLAPTSPTNLSPASGVVISVGTTTLSWTAPTDWGVCSATQSYDVCVSTSASSPCTTGAVVSNLSSATTSYNYNFTTPGTYYWQVAADNGSGLPATNSAVNTLIVNALPTLSAVTLYNSHSILVPWDVGVGISGKSHIQNNLFRTDSSPRTVIYSFDIADANGWTDITSAQMSWNGQVSNLTISGVTATTARAAVTINYPSSANSNGLYPIMVNLADNGGSTGWFDSGYRFKVWDGVVTVVGDVYDSSAEALGAVVSTGVGFTVLAPLEMNFTSVGITDFTSGVGWTAPAVNGNSFSFDLNWGDNYLVTPNADLAGSNIVTRWTDVSTGTVNSGSQRVVDLTTVDPYSNIVSLKIDFSAVRNQNPWFQIVGAGINAAGNIGNMVPVTCANNAACVSAITAELSAGEANNGMVSATSITNNSGCSLTDQASTCRFGKPNDWHRSASTILSKDSLNYQYFYSKYFTSLGLGSTLASGEKMSTVVGMGGSGVVFVNGDFVVDTANTVTVGKSLVIIAKGTITFDPTVNSAQGIFMADGGILAGGTGTQLTISGSMYSSAGNIRLSRDIGTDNNASPSVKVVYRPDMMFNLPGAMLKALSQWRTGQ